ncbi:MAG: hypothetical protein N4A65_13285 [Cohaesibacter sp.]|jgi:hypothetical protein|nr:hypothetical protein [Cohaesibacter sp.]
MTALHLDTYSHHIWGDNLPLWFIALARFGSLVLMAAGLYYWVDILGLFGESGLQRGNWEQHSLRVILSCSFLIAALGVWFLSFWGVVVWVASAGIEIASIIRWDGFAIMPMPSILLQIVGLVALIGACGLVYRQAKQREAGVTD